MKKISAVSKVWRSVKARKFTIIGIIVVCAFGGYEIYRSAIRANAEPQYVLSSVRTGSIIQTVTGSGQVSASNQTDILSQVSGTITGINVSVGQTVHSGGLIATIDSRNAAITLQNARLSYQKLVEPAKATDITNSRNSIDQTYTTAYNAASNIYLDLPDIIAGMKDLLYGQTGFISDQRSSYLSSTARTYRETAGIEYDAAVNLYQKSLDGFKAASRSSATSTIEEMLANTFATIKAMSKAISDTQVAITFITTTQPDYYPAGSPAASTNIVTWATKTNSDLSSLSSAQNSIDTSENAYATLLAGTDNLDLQQAKLTLQQAQQTYDNYFVRAPYDGIIGRIPVNIYGQAGGSTVIATIVGKQKIASISLNEVDAAKVHVGQPVNITFDAIDGLNATGTVSVVDQIGTVSSGVVSYGIKIAIDSVDDRVKPGMSVNTSIITAQKDNVITVPSVTIKTTNGKSVVQVFDPSTLTATSNSTGSSSMRTLGLGKQFASSTRQYNGQNQNRTITISSATPPKQAIVTIGLSDDTNTEVISGLDRGQLVVTKTIAATGTQTTAAPSIFNTLGARAGGGAGGVRTGGGIPTGR